MISAVASVLATRSICSYRSSITGDEPYSSPYDFSPAMPSATRCFACAEALPPAETVGESSSIDAINGESCANGVRCCGAQALGKTDPCDHYLTEIRFNHFDAASGNPCDGWRNRPAHARSKVPEPMPLPNENGKFTG